MTGNIHSIQTLGTVDGPGIRCVVFFQGCPLRCACCHNPDAWDEGGGTPFTPKEVFDKILRIKPYFGKGGGVTLSGGEPLMQPEFTFELLKLCKENGIHTALDTSGCIFNDAAKNLIGLSDLILLDIKFKNTFLYQKYTGGSMDTVLRFLQYANDNNKRVWIRQVILPGINDTKQDITELCELLKPFRSIEKLELLPFRKLCLEKYQMLGIPFAFEALPEADPLKVAALQNFADERLFHNNII
ncbi:MAG: pyruvate formate-lyase-activating protein [Bacillota bacterium]|nr:pyruvate formate-lyase-activating protein [Bacillota bacterium]